MGVKLVTIGVEETIAMLRQTSEKAVKGMSDHLKKSAEVIADTAKEMAPIEHGDLREAIKATPMRGEGGRTEVTVDIDPDRYDEHGRQVLWYGSIMHEALAPYGSGAYKLGKLSQALRDSGAPIGGKFMKRAVAEHREAIYGRAKEIARRAAKRR